MVTQGLYFRYDKASGFAPIKDITDLSARYDRIVHAIKVDLLANNGSLTHSSDFNSSLTPDSVALLRVKVVGDKVHFSRGRRISLQKIAEFASQEGLVPFTADRETLVPL